ncbi:hypothetical protein SDC9_69779 [bioreactor metagenome]|uniref:Uncharacterized protein n=1 Tax=bioreactor metagenome TaxID=1076179 RepID=A0A644Y5T6_9ZZZZ
MRAARGDHLGGRRDAIHVADGREQRGISRKAHHLGFHLEIFAGIAQHAHLAHLHRRHHGLDDGAHHLRDAALDLQDGRVLQRDVHHLGDVVELVDRALARRLADGVGVGVHMRLPSTLWKAPSSALIWLSMLASTRPISLSRMQDSLVSRPSPTMSR